MDLCQQGNSIKLAVGGGGSGGKGGHHLWKGWGIVVVVVGVPPTKLKGCGGGVERVRDIGEG